MRKIGFLLFMALSLVSLPAACRSQDLHDPSLDSVLEKIKKDYGIEVHYAEGPDSKNIDFVYNLADPREIETLKKVVLIFAREIQLYPKDFFRNADCHGIYFVQKLFYKEKPIDGVFSERTDYIFYDYARGSDNEQKIRHNIHHELYHMIGCRHYFWKEHGRAWVALNRPGFSYNPKFSQHEFNPINFSAPPEPGFITDYAMASPEEDRAEVFACMMIPEQLSLMEQWAQKDKILSDKVEMMKEFLRAGKFLSP